MSGIHLDRLPLQAYPPPMLPKVVADPDGVTFLPWPRPNSPFTLRHRLRAGFPSPADDYLEDKIDLNRYLAQHPAAHLPRCASRAIP